jgi:hypothetical protein
VTECNEQGLLFQDLDGRKVVVDFNGGYLSSDGGGLILRELVRDPEGNFWLLPSMENPWDHRQPFQPADEADLERIPGHYKCMQRFAFLLSKDSSIPPMASQSAEGELFLTQSFNDSEQATAWLTGSE